MMGRRIALGLAAMIAFGAAWMAMVTRAEHQSRPEVVRLSTGSTQRVIGGEAQIWLGEVGVRYGKEGLVDAVEYELDCDGDRYHGWVTSEGTAESPCGIVVRLIETLPTTPPSARLEIVRTSAETPDLQAASQVQH